MMFLKLLNFNGAPARWTTLLHKAQSEDWDVGEPNAEYVLYFHNTDDFSAGITFCVQMQWHFIAGLI